MVDLKKIQKYSSSVEPFAGGKQIFSEKIKASLPFLQLIPKWGEKVLVVGCGDGYEVSWLKDQGFKPAGVTLNPEEVSVGRNLYRVNIRVAEMHDLPYKDKSFDVVYAANILEHSVAPYVALKEWGRVLKNKGWLIVVMPSKEWIREYYHFSVLTHSQMKDLLVKSGFSLLAAPEMKAQITYGKGDIFYDLGRGWGHYDGYVVKKINKPLNKFMLGQAMGPVKKHSPFELIKWPLKKFYRFFRVYRARYHHE